MPSVMTSESRAFPYEWMYMGFPGDSMVKEPPAPAGDTGDVGSIPGSGRSSRVGSGNHSSVLVWKTL